MIGLGFALFFVIPLAVLLVLACIFDDKTKFHVFTKESNNKNCKGTTKKIK